MSQAKRKQPKVQNEEKKQQKEIKIINEMIKLYCRKNKHMAKDILCEECKDLKEYALKRIEGCPFKQTKTFCSNCKVHCFKADSRKQIKKVMRYAGPRIILHHPVMALQHLYLSQREKRKQRDAR